MSRAKGEIQSVLIAGPTASGKSGLALALARACHGAVVNADSMQVYAGLQIVTARPSAADLDVAEHRLYGHVRPGEEYSVGAWSRDVATVLSELGQRGRMPIICGGTGLYFRALLGGIDDMPAVPPEIRAAWRQRLIEEGPDSLHDELLKRDPEAGQRIRPGDTQRVLRALEIVEVSGGPLAALQRGRGVPLLDPERTLKILLTPPRPVLRENIARRFDMMIAAGAVAEVEAFADLPGALAGPAGKAIGVAELHDHLAGSKSLEEARERAVTRSRQYAKRQETWFRHQFDSSWQRVVALSQSDRQLLIDAVKTG